MSAGPELDNVAGTIRRPPPGGDGYSWRCFPRLSADIWPGCGGGWTRWSGSPPISPSGAASGARAQRPDHESGVCTGLDGRLQRPVRAQADLRRGDVRGPRRDRTGNTAGYLAAAGLPVLTVERNQLYYALAGRRMAGVDNVHLANLDSRAFLHGLTPPMPEPGCSSISTRTGTATSRRPRR